MIPTGKKQNLEPGEFQPPFYAGVTLLQNIILRKDLFQSLILNYTVTLFY